jgi:tetratricopeptide (TPR) repeat protein
MNMPGDSELRRLLSSLRKLIASSLVESEEQALEGLRVFPESAELLALAAGIERRLKKLDEARSLLGRAKRLDPFHPAVVSEAADLAFEARDFEEAAKRYQELVDRRPNRYHYSRLVMAKTKLGASFEAAATARGALEIFPDDPWLLRGLAAAEAKEGRVSEAAAAYEKLLAIEPQDRFAYKELMRLKTEHEKPEEAAAALKGLMRTGGRDKNPHLKTLAADRLREAGKLSEAAREYESALELEPGSPYVLAQLGFVQKKLGREEEAIETLARAFVANPSDPYVRRSLESLLKKRNELPRFLDLVGQALSFHPEVKSLHGIRKRLARLVGEPDALR